MKPSLNFKIPDKVLETFNKIDVRTRYYLFAAFLAVVFVLDIVVFMGPQIRSMNKVGAENRKLLEDIKLAKSEIGKIETYRSNVKDLQTEVQKVGFKIKLKEEVPLILERISQIATSNDIKIDQIMPTAQAQETIIENNERRFSYLPIVIEAKGGYHNVGRFINQLELDEIFLKLSTFSMSYSTDPRYHKIKMTFNSIISEDVKTKK